MATKKDISEILHALDENKVALAEVLAVTKSNAQKLESFQASLDFAFLKIDSIEKTTIPLLENKIQAVESNYKQQLLISEARSMQYNLVFINPPPFNPDVTNNDKKARRLFQLCGLSAAKANNISLKRSHPLPGDSKQSNANFLVAFNIWEDKEFVLQSARSKPPTMKDMKVVTQWPKMIKMAHGQLKYSAAFKTANQEGKSSYVKIDFRIGKVSLIIADKTIKSVDAWALPV